MKNYRYYCEKCHPKEIISTKEVLFEQAVDFIPKLHDTELKLKLLPLVTTSDNFEPLHFLKILKEQGAWKKCCILEEVV